MIDATRRRGFKSDAGDGDAKDAQHAKELKDAGERTPRPDTWFSLRRGLRGYASTRSASRPSAARRGRQNTMHEIGDTTGEDSSQINPGCHGCHAPVTPRGVTPYAVSQAVYLPAGWGVTGVTARFRLIARAQVRVRTPALAHITRIQAVTPVTPPLTAAAATATGRKAVTPRGVTPRDPAVTPWGWSA